MKRPTLWGAIIGGVIIAGSVYQGAKVLTNPTDLFLVNIAIFVPNLLTVALGVFLVGIYFKSKQKEDEGQEPIKFAPDSPQDIESLAKKRNWIIGFLLLLEIIGSSATWILNDYAAGFAPVNISTIFDVLVNISLLYISIELFKGKRNVLNLLFYTAIVYALGAAFVYIWREHYYGGAVNVLFNLYIIYAIKAPLNRKNFRIAHLAFLPVFVISLFAVTYFDNGNIPELTKKEMLLEQQFLNDSNTLIGTYQLYLQREAPDAREIQDVKDAIEKRDKKSQEIIDNLRTLKSEYEKQISTVAQKETFERIKYLLEMMNIHQAQALKVKELMDYSEKVNFRNLSDKQKSDISNFKKEVDGYLTQLTDVQFKLDNSNLNY
ncbi:hypothetical protein A3I27_00465 [Candidatus Giovannonibacteria bacterium RIFCSPLOWO2_02_FULL_43_11b]|uniref:Uncharacterized protein n=1 Tax=Candidatus Giovannonibacteria bacterium RIFCSPHIGHO2_12_FULL_43_15 TaxID=1798341 RepID=A0A1F5WR19_9BACT|nr:MAG: hypothetical protein A3B97_03590 [Candidatus Giovannonibacteria bacterium RIFCSPHIGHO2_02_FULL_43_32]OGF78113.1 MAG: hypothetical protein A3F23_02845 [Candidatus Giovannonibacteria bacterium RIFCSPHIGHO2_12_FULL_43_15]OGF78520.1 MAG: hypothetical protein A3A15_02745 [Candidatus Giovannonibacteria bacterium RIFCSPLOWO2_01_FULL_43_60]OGF89464.1 MAG: hypothetical protein A3I27_00465 [Candidatus Giovannonibacteria bacterium RIFCSPLOWO2_02_FULL_43_11b]OGF92327.1 MAG: hypothetical protein A3H